MTRKPKLKSDDGETALVETGCGPIYLTIAEVKGDDKDKKLFRIFIKPQKHSPAGCFSAVMEAASRLSGLSTKNGAPLDKIVKHLKGIQCSSPTVKSTSCFDAIAKHIESRIKK